jgi:putative peptide zinc metalloprotease protein
MAKKFLSDDWYRIGPLKPRLRGQVEIHRQTFRGDVWFVIQDLHSGQYHRITPAGNFMLALMNGRRTLAELWEAACERFNEEPPTQSETIQLLSQLHNADLIVTPMPDINEIGERHAEKARQSLMQRVKNPLALSIPLFDPDRFLTATQRYVLPVFSPAGFVAWLALVITGLVLMVMNWDALTTNFVDRLLLSQNIILLLIAYPVLKVFHELGHAYATKKWGGEVHEIGVMMLVFMPVPYVNASASAAFASKWNRAVVGGAGIMVELGISSLALIFWLNAEQGIATAFAFNLMMIGGISTLLFNGNPLLRFDGYFVFSDLIEIPSLGQRSNTYVWHLVQKHILRIRDLETPVRAKGEEKWLFGYAISAFVYRLFISFAIALFIASKFFIVGILLAIWALSNTFVKPLYTGVKFLLTSPKLRGQRRPVIYGTLAAVGALVVAIAVVPLPYATTAFGVVWLEQDNLLRTKATGFWSEGVADTTEVQAGDKIISLSDPFIDARAAQTRAKLAEAELQQNAVFLTDRVQAQVFGKQIGLIQEQLIQVDAQIADLNVMADHAGRVLVPRATLLNDKMLSKGDLYGFFLDETPMRIRVAVSQNAAELVRGETRSVSLIFNRDIETPVMANLIGEVPRSQNTLPSAALSTDGGGDFALNPSEGDDLRAVERVFLFDVKPVDNRPVTFIGERALVRFEHAPQPIFFRIWRSVRQLFLKQFDV